MTKSTGVGRGKGGGGKKPGAGRPRKTGAIKPAASKGRADAAPIAQSHGDGRDWAKNPPQSATELEKLALATLKHIMEFCPQDAPRVSAAREVLVRAKQEELAGGLMGKKAQQAVRVGDLSKPGSRFAVRRHPATSDRAQ